MAGNTSPDPFIVPPTSEHTHTAILLHGLGSNGETFGKELLRSGTTSNSLSLADSFPGIKFIFPTARRRRSSAFKRVTINQWFDVASLDDPSKRRDLQIDGLTESANHVWSILKREADAIHPHHAVLGGLSQDCAMAVFVLLSLEFQLIGSGAADPMSSEDGDDGGKGEIPAPIQAINFVRDILSKDDVDTENLNHTRENLGLATSVFLGHGAENPKIKCSLGKEATETLQMLGMDVTWRYYPELGHWYKIPEEIDDTVEYLTKQLSIQRSGPHAVSTG